MRRMTSFALFFGAILYSSLVVTSCKNEQSEILVANGTPTTNSEFTNPVQMLVDPSTRRGFCTLGFVNDTTAFTALHCVHDPAGISARNMGVITPRGEISVATNVFYNKDGANLFSSTLALEDQISLAYEQMYREDPTCKRMSQSLKNKLDPLEARRSKQFNDFISYDFAILTFPKGTGASFVGANGSYYGISKKAENTANLRGVKYIGFGHNQSKLTMKKNSCDVISNGSGFGTKREGINRNLTLANNRSTFETTGKASDPKNGALTLGGDSGSIWVACFEDGCNSFDAISVTNGGGLDSQGNGSSGGINLYGSIGKTVMRSAVECNAQPCAVKFRGYDEVVLGVSGGADLSKLPVSIDKQIKFKVQNNSAGMALTASIPGFTQSDVFACVSAVKDSCKVNDGSRISLSNASKNNVGIVRNLMAIPDALLKSPNGFFATLIYKRSDQPNQLFRRQIHLKAK